ncbi:MAG: hypothetical protein LUE27_08115 [Clostridia bacterium]|nr:hypothetical protein [Clostridia bacterium]
MKRENEINGPIRVSGDGTFRGGVTSGGAGAFRKGLSTEESVSVGRDVTVGRNAHVGGDAVVKGSLRVCGWLDADNVKQPCVGLYASMEQLIAAHPRPLNGLYALVLIEDSENALPAEVYRAWGGTWTDTGKTSGEIVLSLDSLYGQVAQALEETVSSMVDKAVETAVDAAVDKAVAKAIAVYDFSDAISSALDAYDFSPEIKEAVDAAIEDLDLHSCTCGETKYYTLTIVPTPSDATVYIDGVEQSFTKVARGTTVTWKVCRDGYVTQSGSYTVVMDHTMEVSLLAEEDEYIRFGAEDTALPAEGGSATLELESNTSWSLDTE